jgi:hypothetical protein
MSALHEVALQHRGVVPVSAGCGISLLTSDCRRITSVATDSVAERLNALHDLYQDNPYTSAWRHGVAMWADANTTGDEAGWAQWGVEARYLGVGSLLATTFGTEARRLGVLTIYSPEPEAYGPSDIETVTLFAVAAAHEIERIHTPERSSGHRLLYRAAS